MYLEDRNPVVLVICLCFVLLPMLAAQDIATTSSACGKLLLELNLKRVLELRAHDRIGALECGKPALFQASRSSSPFAGNTSVGAATRTRPRK